MHTMRSSVNTDTSLAEIQVFENSEFGKVRTVVIDGQPCFVGKDVSVALGYKDTVNALKSHVDDEDKRGWQITTPSGKQTAIIINESGLYSLILGSKLESAKKFKRWVTSEVLPTIRKSGSYTFTQTKIVDPVREKEIGLARAEFLRSMAREYAGKSETYPMILDCYAAREVVGEFILPLPQVQEKTYSATEVGKMFGVSANKIGSVAIQHDLKVQGYGAWVKDKARFSSKEVETFRYNDKAVEEIGKILKLEAEDTAKQQN